MLLGGDFTQYSENSLVTEDTPMIVSVSQPFAEFQISNISSNFDAVSSLGSIKTGSSFGSTSANLPITLEYTGTPVSSLTVDLSAGTDRDWSAVNMGTDLVLGKSFVSHLNPTDAPGASAVHSLFIPRTAGTSGVHICPDATSLGDVNTSCSNGRSPSLRWQALLMALLLLMLMDKITGR